MNSFLRYSSMLAWLFYTVASAQANISLPSIFGNHMVLQQQTDVTIWGWGKPGEQVTVTGSWAPEKSYSLKVGNQSRWSIDIQTPGAGGPYQLIVQGYNRIELDDILIGEVWLGSGQSNMEWSANMGIDSAARAIAKANFPEIRFFTVLTSTATTPQQHLAGQWVKCTPENMANFSALLYFFGRELHQNLSVPVGLIHSAWGGTPAEVWIPENSILQDRLLHENASLLKEVGWSPKEAGRIYNAMIHPLIPFRIKGALWYQGESNTRNPRYYARTLSTLIYAWRAAWGYDFPFYFVQIAPYRRYGADNVNGAIVRDQQRRVLAQTARTGMVVVSDIGNLDNIHPGNKEDVGKRLASWALKHDYSKTVGLCSGPLYRSHTVENGQVRIEFDYAEGGLTTRDGPLSGFELAGTDGVWQPAEATIQGAHVLVSSTKITKPVWVRFAFRNDSEPNLFNQAGLPASCFTTE